MEMKSEVRRNVKSVSKRKDKKTFTSRSFFRSFARRAFSDFTKKSSHFLGFHICSLSHVLAHFLTFNHALSFPSRNLLHILNELSLPN